MNPSTKNKLAFFFSAALLFAVAAVVLLQFNHPVSEEQTVADVALAFIKNVARIDVAKYNVNLTGHNTRTDMYGGVSTEMVKYTLNSDTSKLDAIVDFLNGPLSGYILCIDEGVPFYTQPPTTIANNAKETFERFQRLSRISYPIEMTDLLRSLDSSTTNITLESNNLKLTASIQGNNASIKCFYTENGFDYVQKSVSMTFENGNLKTFGADWSLYTVGNTFPTITREVALKTAVEAVETTSLT